MADFRIVTEIFYDGAWFDISADVRNRDPVMIERGVPDEATVMQPSSLSFTLNNGASNVGAGVVVRYSPRNPRSDLFGKIGRNTPVRQSIEGSRRFTGEISEWPTHWELAATEIWTTVQAFGILRRLGQGGGKPAQPALRRRLTSLPFGFPDAYWPLDGGTLSAAGRPVLGASDFRLISATPARFQFETAELASWIGPGLKLFVDTSDDQLAVAFEAPVVMPDVVTELSAEHYFRYPDDPPLRTAVAAEAIITELRVQSAQSVTAAGFPQEWRVLITTYDEVIHRAPCVRLQFFLAGVLDTQLLAGSESSVVIGNLFDGKVHHVQLRLEDTGTNLAEAKVNIDGINAMTMAVNPAPNSLRGAASVRFSYTAGSAWLGSANPAPVAIGHLALRHTLNPGAGERITDHTTFVAAGGHLSEAAGRRIERLCGEEGIPFSSSGNLDETEPMGHQYREPILTLLDQAATLDGGILFEDRQAAGLAYATLRSLYNRVPALALDYSSGHVSPPFEPIDDDQHLVNDATVRRIDGGEAGFVKTSGALSTAASPAGVGRYDRSYEVNAPNDDRLVQFAAARVEFGTLDESRFPEIGFHVLRHEHLRAAYLAVDSGSWVTIDRPPPWLAPNQIGCLVRGYRERYSRSDWFAELWTTPSRLYAVGVLDTDRLDSNAATVATAFDTTTMTPTTAGSLSVAFAAGAALATPFFLTDSYIIEAAGVRMLVVAVLGSSSPQTFQVVQVGPAIPKIIPAGSTVHLAKPFRLAL